MNYNQQETFTKLKSNKTLDLTTTKSNKTFITKMVKCCATFKNCFLWIINKINSFLSKCSILAQFTLIIFPLSIITIVSLYLIHSIFYKNLFLFNFYKGVKEEFLDYYITQIDDMNAEFDSFLIKENKVDTEDQLFFEVYFQILKNIQYQVFMLKII